MANSYDDFWYENKNTSKVFGVSILLGLLLASPAILTFLAFSEEVIAVTNAFVLSPLGLMPLPGTINLGVDVSEWLGLGDEWSYRINVLSFQLGIAGSSLWWLAAALRAFSLKWANTFILGALPIFILFFGGLNFGLSCWYRLRIAGVASDDTPVAGAILLTAIILIGMVLYIDHKTGKTAS